MPYGAPRSPAVPNERELCRAAEALARARLHCGDFESIVLAHAERGDFVYLDPPFHSSSTRIFTQYNATPFAEGDLGRLTNLLKELSRRKCKFLLSYAHTSEAMKAFAKFDLEKIVTRRNISGFPQHRRIARELLVRNF